MCTENTLKIILDDVCHRAKNEFGTALDAVILYGSYARGDYISHSLVGFHYALVVWIYNCPYS